MGRIWHAAAGGVLLGCCLHGNGLQGQRNKQTCPSAVVPGAAEGSLQRWQRLHRGSDRAHTRRLALAVLLDWMVRGSSGSGTDSPSPQMYTEPSGRGYTSGSACLPVQARTSQVSAVHARRCLICRGCKGVEWRPLRPGRWPLLVGVLLLVGKDSAVEWWAAGAGHCLNALQSWVQQCGGTAELQQIHDVWYVIRTAGPLPLDRRLSSVLRRSAAGKHPTWSCG